MRTNQKKPNRKIKRNRSKNHDPVLDMRPAFKGQVCQSMKVECTPLLFSSAITTGLINPVFTVSTASVSNFATRFGSLYEEYRIVKAKFSVRLFSSINPGLLIMWVDEKSASAPTLAESRTKSNARDIVNGSATNRTPTLTWTPHDPVDQQYTAISTNTVFASFKIYSDNTNYGSYNVVTSYGEIFAEFTFQFRGLI
jgi:hypothetical protein